MDKSFELDKILNNIDFSQGREKEVWEKIVSRLSDDVGILSISELEGVAGGLSDKNGNGKSDIH